MNEKIWKYYDYGPKDVNPLVCIPGAGGSAEVFFKQLISLCPRGIRIIAVQPAAYDTHQGWCKGLDKFLDKLSVSKVHLFGTALGGYLAQCFAQYRPARVESIILNNTFSDTQYFHDHSPCAAMFTLMPEFMLKRILLENFPVQKLEPEIANSVDFMVDSLESLSQAELASRLTLNCSLGFLRPGDVTLPQEHITIIDTLDDIALPENVREEVYKFYPDAKVAHLKDGGNFPYLSRADEVNLHIQVHLRKYGIPKPTDPEPQPETETGEGSSSSSSKNTNGTPHFDDTKVSAQENDSPFVEKTDTADSTRPLTTES